MENGYKNQSDAMNVDARSVPNYVDDDDNDDDYQDPDPDFTPSQIKSKEDENLVLKPNQSLPRTREHDAISTLLSTFGGNSFDDAVENFIKQNITMKDLSTLTKDDLFLLGITNEKQQQELLNTFSELPKQAPDYDAITTSQDTVDYNNRILSASSNYLNTMKVATSATNLKLKVIKTEDTLVDDEEFASKYILQTIDELKQIIAEMDERIELLEELTDDKQNSKEYGLLDTVCVLAGVTVISLAFLFWKRN